MVARAESELPTSDDTSPIILKDAIRNLKTLVPTAPTTVGDWLIQFTTCVSERTLEVLRQPRDLVPTTSEAFAEYANIAYSTAEEVADADIMFPDWLKWYQHMQHEVYSLLLGKVDWAKEPTLARAIRSGTKVDKSDSIHNTRDGHSFFAALQTIADINKVDKQLELTTEWARIFAAAHGRTDAPRAVHIFSSGGNIPYQQVERRLHQLLDNYEATAGNAEQPAHIFITVVLKLFVAEIPALAAWASTQITELHRDPTKLGTSRIQFLVSLAPILVGQLESDTAVITSALADGETGHLNVARGAAVTWRPPGGGDRRPPPSGGGYPPGLAPRRPRIFNAGCNFCDCRGCAATDKDPMSSCAVLGNAKPKRDASEDEINHVSTNRGFLRRNPEFKKPPYMKGEATRVQLGRFSRLTSGLALRTDFDASRDTAGRELRRKVMEFALPAANAGRLKITAAADDGEPADEAPADDAGGEPDITETALARFAALFAHEDDVDPDDAWDACQGTGQLARLEGYDDVGRLATLMAPDGTPVMRSALARRQQAMSARESAPHTASTTAAAPPPPTPAAAPASASALSAMARTTAAAPPTPAAAPACASTLSATARAFAPAAAHADSSRHAAAPPFNFTAFAQLPQLRGERLPPLAPVAAASAPPRAPPPVVDDADDAAGGDDADAMAAACRASAEQPQPLPDGSEEAEGELACALSESLVVAESERADDALRAGEHEIGALARALDTAAAGAEPPFEPPSTAHLPRVADLVDDSDLQRALLRCEGRVRWLEHHRRQHEAVQTDAHQSMQEARQRADAIAAALTRLAERTDDNGMRQAKKLQALEVLVGELAKRPSMETPVERPDELQSCLDQLRAHDKILQGLEASQRHLERTTAATADVLDLQQRCAELSGQCSVTRNELRAVHERLDACAPRAELDDLQERLLASLNTSMRHHGDHTAARLRGITEQAQRDVHTRVDTAMLDHLPAVSARLAELDALAAAASAERAATREKLDSLDVAVTADVEYLRQASLDDAVLRRVDDIGQQLSALTAGHARADELRDAVAHLARQHKASSDAQAAVNSRMLEELTHIRAPAAPRPAAVPGLAATAGFGFLAVMIACAAACGMAVGLLPLPIWDASVGRVSMMAATNSSDAGSSCASCSIVGDPADVEQRAGHLFDSGATHLVRSDTRGAIRGSWRPSVRGLLLGDNHFLPAYGSVEMDFQPPPHVGGPDIRRRVLICPGVVGSVWSQPQEVDVYKSTYVDAPDGRTYLQLADGRQLPLRVTPNGLRWLDLAVRGTRGAAHAAAGPAVGDLAAGRPPGEVPGLYRITGVGKRHVPLLGVQFLWLWHNTLGHLHVDKLLNTLRYTLVISDGPDLASSDIRDFNRRHCDTCDAFKQKKLHPREPDRRAHDDADEKFTPKNDLDASPPEAAEYLAVRRPLPSIHRSLTALHRVLLDVFGPVRWPSAQHNYRYLIGYVCEATGMRWVFGAKDHVEATVEGVTQALRASIRLLRPDLELDVIRTDGAPENRSAAWRDYLVDGGMLHEESTAYDPQQMGAIERTWGLSVPSASAMLSAGGLGKSHWHSATRYAVILGNLVESTVATVVGAAQCTSAFFRFFQVRPSGDHLHPYGAPVRFHLDPTQRDSKFD